MFKSAYQALSPAERAFVDRYIDGLDAEAARTGQRMTHVIARRSIGPAEVAQSNGMLDRMHVQYAIVERVEKFTNEREIAPSRVINEYEAIAFSNMLNYIKILEDGWIEFDFSKVSEFDWKAVKSFEIENGKDGRRKYKVQLYDKPGALAQFMKYMGLDDSENPHWRAERARRMGPLPMIEAKATVTQASDAYSRLLESVAG